jgi:hypothetical protein
MPPGCARGTRRAAVCRGLAVGIPRPGPRLLPHLGARAPCRSRAPRCTRGPRTGRGASPPGGGRHAPREALEAENLITRLLPDWERVRCRPQRNRVHRWTVDRHLACPPGGDRPGGRLRALCADPPGAGRRAHRAARGVRYLPPPARGRVPRCLVRAVARRRAVLVRAGAWAAAAPGAGAGRGAVAGLPGPAWGACTRAGRPGRGRAAPSMIPAPARPCRPLVLPAAGGPSPGQGWCHKAGCRARLRGDA